MSLTTDPKNPDLRRGIDSEPREQSKTYLVLSAEELAKGYVKPYRTSYVHDTCRTVTKMGHELSATYARDPWFYGATYCVGCRMHRPLAEFHWDDGEPMDPSKWPEAEHDRIAAMYDGQQKQPINNRTLATIEADLRSRDGALIRRVDYGGFDGYGYELSLGGYEVARETVERLLKRGVIEPFPNGSGYSVKRPQPSADCPQGSPNASVEAEITGAS